MQVPIITPITVCAVKQKAIFRNIDLQKEVAKPIRYLSPAAERLRE